MARSFTHKKLLIASGNEGKVNEISRLLERFNVEVLSAAEFDLPEPEETGSTFVENAVLKAKYYSKKTNLPALADDSGLCVEVLKGAPGVFSARWAGENKDFVAAMNRVRDEVRLLQSTDNNTFNNNAKFMCTLALHWPDEHTETFEGVVEGTLTFPPRGSAGFGYDPIFIPKGYNQTFAEISADEKQKISHRANAFAKLVDGCFKS